MVLPFVSAFSAFLRQLVQQTWPVSGTRWYSKHDQSQGPILIYWALFLLSVSSLFCGVSLLSVLKGKYKFNSFNASWHDCLWWFSSVQLLSCVWLFATPWTTAQQSSLSITNTRSPPKPTSIESVIPSSHLILCRPLLLLPSIFPTIKVSCNDSALHIRWPKYWSFSFNISPSNEHPGLISLGWTVWISLQSKGLSRVFSNTTVQKHQFFGAQLSL